MNVYCEVILTSTPFASIQAMQQRTQAYIHAVCANSNRNGIENCHVSIIAYCARPTNTKIITEICPICI